MITFEFATSSRTYLHARTRDVRREYDNEVYRAPLRPEVQVAGTGRALPETVRIEIELYPTGPVDGVNPSWETEETLVTRNTEQVTYGGGNVTYSVHQTLVDQLASLEADIVAAERIVTRWWTADVLAHRMTQVRPVGTGYVVEVEWIVSSRGGASPSANS